MPNIDDLNDIEESKNQNTIIELNSTDEETAKMDSVEVEEISDTELKVKPMPKRSNKYNKKSFKEKWSDLPKGTKIAIIVIPVIVILVIIALLVYFLVLKKDEEKPLDPAETIVIEKDNYKYQNGFLIFLDESDNEIGKYECKNKDVDRCYVAPLSNEDDFDVAEYLNSKNEEIQRTSKVISNRYVFVFDEDKISLYDMKEEASYGDYELIKTGNIDENYVVVKERANGYGILSFKDSSYEELIKPSYEYLGIMNSSKAFVAKEDDKSFLINSANEVLTAKLNGDIKQFSDKYISLYTSDKYALYDYKGTALIQDDGIEYLDFKDNYDFAIKDGRIYAYDDTLYKLTETGYKLKAKEYRPAYIFDDKNNYKETKSAYSLTIDDAKITIEIDGKDREINVNEGRISKQLPYVNYFDGSLFFYADQEKTDLIGSYTCTNENNVTSSTKTLDNCFVAQAQNIVNDSDTMGYIPIINNKYVFIRDTSSSDTNQRIVITDIENAKVLGTYQKVDVLYRTADVSHISSLDELVYAQNTSGKYGVIKIDATTASKKLNFDYSSISIFKNDYLLAKDSEYYRLFDLTKLSPENEIIRSKYTIVDYSYGNFIVNKDKKYTVYNENGKIVSVDLDFAKLESDLLIGVKDKKLNLYSYDQDAKGILQEEIDLSSIKYTDISVDNKDGYVITIKLSDKTEMVYKYDRQGKKITEPATDEEEKPDDNKDKGEDTSEKE